MKQLTLIRGAQGVVDCTNVPITTPCEHQPGCDCTVAEEDVARSKPPLRAQPPAREEAQVCTRCSGKGRIKYELREDSQGFPWDPDEELCPDCAQPQAREDAQPVGWLRAVDEEMVCAHLGVADAEDSFETAKKKLASLIQWNIAVATDPSVGGHPAPDALRVAVEALEALAGEEGDCGEKVYVPCTWKPFREVARQALATIAALQ